MISFTAMCSLGSLTLGVVALVLPVLGLIRAQKGKAWQRYSVLSMVFCAAALQLQLECAANWVRGEDISALLDCVNAQAFAGRMLLFAALGLNALAALAADTKTPCDTTTEE